MGSLLVGADGKFSPARFEQVKKLLYDALAEADRALAQTLAAARGAGTGPAKAYAERLLANVPISQQRLALFRRQVDMAALSVNEPLWSTDLVPGRGITRYAFMLGQIEQEARFHRADAAALGLAENETFWRALGESAAALGLRMYRGLGPVQWVLEHVGHVALVLVLVPLLLRARRAQAAPPAAGPRSPSATAGALSGVRWAPSPHLPRRPRRSADRTTRTRRRRARRGVA